MKTVDELIADVLRREGGYVNHPADRGGPTKYGITQRTYSRYVGYAVTAEQVKNLDIEAAKDLVAMRKEFRKLEEEDEPVEEKVFQAAVAKGAQPVPNKVVREWRAKQKSHPDEPNDLGW